VENKLKKLETTNAKCPKKNIIYSKVRANQTSISFNHSHFLHCRHQEEMQPLRSPYHSVLHKRQESPTAIPKEFYCLDAMQTDDWKGTNFKLLHAQVTTSLAQHAFVHSAALIAHCHQRHFGNRVHSLNPLADC
jgi:hypothetical protein